MFRLSVKRRAAARPLKPRRVWHPTLCCSTSTCRAMSGLETRAPSRASLSTPPAVIFATAFDEYALQAFDAQAIAYLLKPVRKDKLTAALGSAARLTRPQIARAAAAGSSRCTEGRSHVATKRRDGIKLIPVDSVFAYSSPSRSTRGSNTRTARM